MVDMANVILQNKGTQLNVNSIKHGHISQSCVRTQTFRRKYVWLPMELVPLCLCGKRKLCSTEKEDVSECEYTVQLFFYATGVTKFTTTGEISGIVTPHCAPKDMRRLFDINQWVKRVSAVVSLKVSHIFF